MEETLFICGAITTIAAAVGILFGCIIWAQRITEGIRCQLRTAMLRTYYKCKEEKKIRQFEAENFEKNYNAYKALKGNSFIDEIHKKVETWEVIT